MMKLPKRYATPWKGGRLAPIEATYGLLSMSRRTRMITRNWHTRDAKPHHQARVVPATRLCEPLGGRCFTCAALCASAYRTI
jgi:hypothetical protein